MKQAEFVKKIKEIKLTTFRKSDINRLFPKEKFLDTAISRLARANVLRRIARGLYTLSDSNMDLERIATIAYRPSYVSFESALAKYGIINQGQNILTLATTKHSKKIKLDSIECEYRKIKPNLFFGFNLVKDTYLAEPEKAILDTLYLAALGKKMVDSTEWDLSAINPTRLKKQAKLFGKATEKSALRPLG